MERLTHQTQTWETQPGRYATGGELTITNGTERVSLRVSMKNEYNGRTTLLTPQQARELAESLMQRAAEIEEEQRGAAAERLTTIERGDIS